MIFHRATICLGSNTPDCSLRLAYATKKLTRVARITASSDEIESADVTGRGKPYRNVVVELHTTLRKEQLLDFMALLERRGGRTAASKESGVMPLDIDLVVWDGCVVSEADFDAPYFRNCLKQMPR